MFTDNEKITMKLGCFGLLLLSCAGCGGCFLGSKVKYSEGHRDGIVEKISNKGIFYKTDEGRMVLGGMQFDGNDGGGNLTARIFDFSVSDPEIKKQIDDLPPGKRVRLHYEQKLLPWMPNGETQYFITKVEEIK